MLVPMHSCQLDIVEERLDPRDPAREVSRDEKRPLDSYWTEGDRTKKAAAATPTPTASAVAMVIEICRC